MTPGYLQWRDGGEKHMNDPMTIANLQVFVASIAVPFLLATVIWQLLLNFGIVDMFQKRTFFLQVSISFDCLD